jgi:transcriptional regulator with XRE-family HTH domain
MDAIRIGRSVRALRRRRRWRQADLAERAATSRGSVQRIEAGLLGGVTLATLERVIAALGARLDVSVRWNGEALDRLLDEAHAQAVEAIVRRLRSCDWEVAVETSFGIGGKRGSIDVMAIHPSDGSLLVIEVKSVIADSQQTLHGLDRKARLGPAVAEARGWRWRSVSRLLVVQESRTNRRRVATHAETFGAALPVRNREVVAWLSGRIEGGRRRPIAGLLFVDARGRRDGPAGSPPLPDARQDNLDRDLVSRERVRHRGSCAADGSGVGRPSP